MGYAIVDKSTLTVLRDKVLSKDRELAQLGNEINSMRHSVRGESQAHAIEVLKLQQQLAASQAMNNAKQQEIAQLRSQVTDIHARWVTAIDDAANERHNLMDAYARGFGAQPIFATPPTPQPEPVEQPKAVTGKEVPESDVTKAIRTAGMSARGITKQITRQKDVDFNDAMVNSGVRKLFEGDKAEGEAQAVVGKEA